LGHCKSMGRGDWLIWPTDIEYLMEIGT